MPGVASVVWELLTAAGGTLALSLIISIAIGINALTLLFVGSAVVTLERFARVAARWRSVLGFGLGWAALLGAGSLYWNEATGAELDLLSRWALASAASALAVALAVGLTWLTLRRVSSFRLATASLVLLGVGFALVVGASGRLLHAAAPAAVAVVLAGLLAWRRRRRGGAERGEAERLLGWLGGALALGVVLAAALPAPQPSIAGAGAGLLGAIAAIVLLGLVPLAAAGLIDARRSVECSSRCGTSSPAAARR